MVQDQDALESAETMPAQGTGSPPWSRSTKIIIVVSALLLLSLLAWRFQGLIALITMAAILAYIFKPTIDFITERTRISRGIVIVVVYLLLAVVVIGIFVLIGVAVYDQAGNLINLVPAFIATVTNYFESFSTSTEPIQIGPFQLQPVSIPWERISTQLLNLVEPALGTSGQFVSRLATGTVRTMGNILFIFVISIYLASELPRLSEYIGRMAHQPGYQDDARRLMNKFGRIWNAYLRGQLVLGVIIFLVVWLGLTFLGVRNALVLGLISGLLEFIPNVGPVIGAGAAMIVAFFQPTNPFGLEPWQFSLLVLALMIVIQQLENHLLVPRIMGQALDLNPLVVIIGVFMGASLAGILGAILAAPIIASLKLLGTYTWRKMFDLPPFAEPAPEQMGDGPSLSERLGMLLDRLRGANKNVDNEAPHGSSEST